MSLAGSQQKIYLRLIAAIRPNWRQDRNLPSQISELFSANRSFGSRDRRLYRELIYTTLRYLPWIEPLLDTDPRRAAQTVAWLAADLPATRAYRAEHCRDWPPCPPTVAAKAAHLKADATALLPEWLVRHCPDAAKPAELDALHARASLWLRLQTSDPAAIARVLAEFTAAGWSFRRSPILTNAIELLADADVTKTKAWESGLIEIQDLGSQLILETIGLARGGRWLDACAGAGGKTLQLATLLGPTGHVDATDIRPAALRELQTRAARAGLKNISVLDSPPFSASSPDPAKPPAPSPTCNPIGDKPASASPASIPNESPRVCNPIGDKTTATHSGENSRAGSYDGILVDAPCSGSGTWRRSPHLKWATTPNQVTQAAETQLSLLTQFAPLVRSGGHLVYATCSLSRLENEDVVTAFLAAHPNFSAVPAARPFKATPRSVGLAILPSQHNTDGFYVASLRRR